MTSRGECVSLHHLQQECFLFPRQPVVSLLPLRHFKFVEPHWIGSRIFASVLYCQVIRKEKQKLV